MSDNGAVQSIFDRLVDERGGAEKLTTADLAIVRAMARLLAADDLDARGAQSVASLAALLPPPLPRKVEVATPPPNLELLTDEQLHELDVLMSIATGTAPAEAPPPEPETWRCKQAIELARVLDFALGVVVPPNPVGDMIDLDDEVLARIRSLSHRVLYPLAASQLHDFRGLEQRAIAAEARAADAEKRAADLEQRALRAEHQVETARRSQPRDGGKVVPLRVPEPNYAPGLHSGGVTQRVGFFGDHPDLGA